MGLREMLVKRLKTWNILHLPNRVLIAGEGLGAFMGRREEDEASSFFKRSLLVQDEVINQKCSLVKDEEKLEATRLKFIDQSWSFQQNRSFLISFLTSQIIGSLVQFRSQKTGYARQFLQNACSSSF